MVLYIEEPLTQWAKRAWADVSMQRFMAVAFDHAWRTSGGVSSDKLTGHGPAHAVVQAIRRLRWRPISALKVGHDLAVVACC